MSLSKIVIPCFCTSKVYFIITRCNIHLKSIFFKSKLRFLLLRKLQWHKMTHLWCYYYNCSWLFTVQWNILILKRHYPQKKCILQNIQLFSQDLCRFLWKFVWNLPFYAVYSDKVAEAVEYLQQERGFCTKIFLTDIIFSLVSDQKTPNSMKKTMRQVMLPLKTYGRILFAYFFGYWRTSDQDALGMSPFL